MEAMAGVIHGGSPSAAAARHPVLAACEALDEGIPALTESRTRVLAAARTERPSRMLEGVESDLALTIAVLREANRHAEAATVRDAIDLLGPNGIEAVAEGIPTTDFFQRLPGCEVTPDDLRQHAVTTRQIADRLAGDLELDRDELCVAALLHDVGKTPLCMALPGYPTELGDRDHTPEQRLQAERALTGVDHAVVGGMLIRRWGLPEALAHVVARHHEPEADGVAGLIRVADMVAHYTRGDRIDPGSLHNAADRVGVTDDALREVMHMPAAGNGRPRGADPCPLSRAEIVALRGLAEGKALKELAAELGRAPSTIRSQLHGCYRKLGVRDRAQAVLIASERGWL
jgi:putative nucleotidyltransferase with HDIG domain